jgi:hypothetical protein
MILRRALVAMAIATVALFAVSGTASADAFGDCLVGGGYVISNHNGGGDWTHTCRGGAFDGMRWAT